MNIELLFLHKMKHIKKFKLFVFRHVSIKNHSYLLVRFKVTSIPVVTFGKCLNAPTN
jgi:hypothetical protein